MDWAFFFAAAVIVAVLVLWSEACHIGSTLTYQERLKTVWTDPEFDPRLHASYYARLLEIPTPRWTTIQAHQLGVAPPDVVSATVQERAWSSTIWYTPSDEARKNAKPDVTVTDLKKEGATASSNSLARNASAARCAAAIASETAFPAWSPHSDISRSS